MANCTRVVLVAEPSELQPVVQRLRVLSPMMDDMIPASEDLVDLAAVDAAPTGWDEDAKRANEAKLGVLKFATLSPAGVEPIYKLFQEELRNHIGMDFDLEKMALVPCAPADRKPFLGSREWPCRCTACNRDVYIELESGSELLGRWRLFSRDVSPCMGTDGKDHIARHQNKDGTWRTRVVNDRTRDTRFGGLHHSRCEPSNRLQMEELLGSVRGAVAKNAAKKRNLSSAAQKAAAAAAAAAAPTVSYEEAAELGAVAAEQVRTEEEQKAAAAADGATAMEVEEPGAEELGTEEEPGAAAVALAGPPYVCASCLKSLQSLSRIKSHIVRGRPGMPCQMGAELGGTACRTSIGPGGGAAPVAERAALPVLLLTLRLFWHPEPLTAAEAATRNAADPSSFVDKKVSVNFPDDGTYVGTVHSFDRVTGYHVVFDDDDEADYGILELSRMCCRNSRRREPVSVL